MLPNERAFVGNDGLGEPLLTVQEVAAYLSIHRATVYRLAGKCNGIPCVEIRGTIRFRPSDVRAFVEKSTVANVGADRVDRLLGPRK